MTYEVHLDVEGHKVTDRDHLSLYDRWAFVAMVKPVVSTHIVPVRAAVP
jgi:hypothetical protein